MKNLDLGLMVEGVVELDPMTGRLVIRHESADGVNTFADIQDRLLQYKGQSVRCIITPMSSIAQLAHLVEKGGMSLEDIPTVPKLG